MQEVLLAHKWELLRMYQGVLPPFTLSYALCSEHYVALAVGEGRSVVIREGFTFTLAKHDARVYPPLCLFCTLKYADGDHVGVETVYVVC